MKRLTAILLACLLLCGCAAPVVDESQPTEIREELPPVDPTEPGGSYDPNSTVEQKTAGAVRAYPLSIAGAYAIAVMGSDIVIFSGSDNTTLTKLTGENLYVTASAQAGCRIHPGDASVQVTDKGLSFFSPEDGQIILLDTNLQESGRITLPKDLAGTPILSQDWTRVYYCTADSIRVLTLADGISRLLKEISYHYQSPEAVLLNDTVLQVSLRDESQEKILFLSTQTGQTLAEYSDPLTLVSSADTWYATGSEGIMSAFVYGQAQADPTMLVPEDYTAQGIWLAELGCLMTQTAGDSAEGIRLELYDAATGKRFSRLDLEGSLAPTCVDTDTETGLVYLLCPGFDGNLTLYRWDAAGTPIADETVYSCPRYTLTSPDTEGLAACYAHIADMEERYQVDIRIGTEATAVKNNSYVLYPEYQVPVLTDALTELDRLLSVFPQGMLKTAMSGISDEPIRICIVRKITGSPESGNLSATGGIQFWNGDENYVVLAIGYDTPAVLYRQMYYALENCLMSNSNDLYDWEYLNPSGFDYDYDYVTYLTRESTQYLEGEKRYFVDAYSLTFPREDRAAIMQYAMTEGNEAVFETKYMQAKLRALGKAIREACDLEKSTEVFLWEQYLTKPLAYGQK